MTDAAIGGTFGGVSKGLVEVSGKGISYIFGKATSQGSKVSTGAENVATYPKLKEELVQQNLNNIAKQDSRLASAIKGDNGKLNFGIGSGTSSEADKLGKIWVGDGTRLARDQKNCPGCIVSMDGLRVYRPPATKPNTPTQYNPTGIQANFIQKNENGKIISNGHLIIK